ncbi:MAG: hypothetical protein R2754_03200 [Microthrixaceae bacterium]
MTTEHTPSATTGGERYRREALRCFRAVLAAIRNALTPPLLLALGGAAFLICLTLVVAAQRGGA